MNKLITMAAVVLSVLSSCTMQNPLLSESGLPYGAPQFDKIRNEHYIPAFTQAVAESKAEVDAITDDPAEPDFDNTILALEQSGRTLDRVSGIFFNLLEAVADDKKQSIAETVTPMLTECSMYVTLNESLFQRIKTVWDKRESLSLDPDQARLLEKTYKSFVRNGANLSLEDKALFSKYTEELSFLSLQFNKNVLASTNAFVLNLTDREELAGLPDFVVEQGAAAAAEKGLEGWAFDLSYPSYGPFMKYSTRADLREKLYRAYNTRALGGDTDNTEIIRKIVELRLKTANLLGYETYAQYAIEERMAASQENVEAFLQKLSEPTLPVARAEMQELNRYARENGFEGEEIMPWDFSYWSEKLMEAKYAVNDELLKPYFRLEDCIDAVFDLAHRLYGVSFTERNDIPGYHKDVKVYDVTDASGKHLSLFYADFFPRESKSSGAWMTEFRGQYMQDGVEYRPFVSIVTNFTKPTAKSPSLLTHSEFTTFLHEFGHALHGMLAEGRYGSLCGTNVSRDFVELPSQIMENWAYEPEYLNTFARHYQTGETLPQDLIDRLVAAKNYHAAYAQMRQLHFGLLDMAWHTVTSLPEQGTVEFEKAVLADVKMLPDVPECAISTSFGHIFSGGYSAGYYSYKWAEVLEADAFSLFQEKGIFNTEVASSFRENILSKGSSEDEAVLYRRFRGHDPEPEALLLKLGIISR